MEARSNDVPILVTGGTGTLGRLVVARLRQAGRDVRVFSRGRTDDHMGVRQAGTGIEHSIGDLSSGLGIDNAVEGIEIIIHLAGTAKGDELKATNLARAASGAGVKHLVFISVVGADRVPAASAMDRAMFGYFASKLAAERIVAESGLPYSTLRATQFHQLALATAQGMARMPVIPVPSGFRFQPVDADEVAARLVELALAAPTGMVPAIAGPRVYEMAELVRGYLRATGKHRIIVPMPLMGAAARAFRAGANLAPERAVGRVTWEDFLATWVRMRRDSRLAAA